MDFKLYFAESAAEIDIFLKNYLAGLLESVTGINGRLHSLLLQFTEACKNGKRLRGVLVKLGYNVTDNGLARQLQTFGSGGVPNNANISDTVFFPAIAYEIFQTAILAHDDIIDKSPVRRGMPSLYMSLGNNHYGISQGICLGDVGLFLSNKIICDSPIDDYKKAKIINSFVDTQYNTSIGELLDIELSYSDDIALEDILTVYEYKTSYYTIIGPLQLGAILGDADQNLLEQLKEFGKNLGIAFQIKDDMLEIFGDKKITGKSNSSDIEEGKITVLWHFFQTGANEQQKQLFNKIYGSKNIGSAEIDVIKNIMEETKAPEKAEALMKHYIDKARGQIAEMAIADQYKTILYELSDFMVEREK